jgi:hypothetical protein
MIEGSSAQLWALGFTAHSHKENNIMIRTLALVLCLSLTYGSAANHGVPLGSRLKRVGMARVEPHKEKTTV